MAKRSLARAKGRPQKALVTYLTAPIGSKVRLSFPDAKRAAENLRSAVYALRNDLLEAMPDAAAIFWIPPAYSGQTSLLISRLEALTQTLLDQHTLILHDGTLSKGTSLDISVEEGETPLPAKPTSPASSNPPARSQEDIDAEVAAYEQARLQEQLDKAIAYIKKAEAAKGTVMEMVYTGGRGQEELEAAKALLAEHNITI